MNRKKVIARRRSRSLAGFASKDLCERVPASLNPSERLMMLLNLSFQYALSVVQKEVMSEDFDSSEYREKGNECWEKVKSAVEKRNLEKLAVAENSISESFRCDNFEDFNEQMALFDEEYVKWREEVQSYRRDLEMSSNTPYVVDSSAAQEDNEQQYNYSDVVEPILSTHNKLAHQVSSLSSTKKVFEACLEVDRKYCQALRLKSENHFQQDTTYSPRTLMKELSSARTYTKPYSLRKQ